MLAHVLALTVGLGSIAIYLAASFSQKFTVKMILSGAV